MKIDINSSKSDLSAMILSAARYALGRRTYIVSWTCEFIENNLHILLEKDIKVIIRDIKEQEKNYGLGDNCDINNWRDLLFKLEKYIEEENI